MVTEIPPLRSLERLERLELRRLPALAQLPDLSAQKKLVRFAVTDAEVCCNGLVGSCDLSSVAGRGSQATCVDSNAVSILNLSLPVLLKKFNATMCV